MLTNHKHFKQENFIFGLDTHSQSLSSISSPFLLLSWLLRFCIILCFFCLTWPRLSFAHSNLPFEKLNFFELNAFSTHTLLLLRFCFTFTGIDCCLVLSFVTQLFSDFVVSLPFNTRLILFKLSTSLWIALIPSAFLYASQPEILTLHLIFNNKREREKLLVWLKYCLICGH